MRVQPPLPLPSLSAFGLLLAVVALHQSLAPTLLTRSWYLQGVVTGISVVLGYGFGALVQHLGGLLLRAVTRLSGRALPELSPRVRDGWNVGFQLVLALLVAAAVTQSISERRWTWERLHEEDGQGALRLLGTALLALAVIAVLALMARAVRWAQTHLTWAADLLLPRWIAAVLATVLVAWGLSSILNNWVYQRTMSALNETFTLGDSQVADGLVPPTSEVRSAGPASAVAWDELGQEGRAFVTSGPSTDEIAALHPQGAAEAEPIRVFVGREQEADPDRRAEIALAEMESFGAFEREAVLVVIPTGTGWVNEQAVQPIEHLYAGDTATVSMQYSHLPSPLAFLTEAQAAREAGAALIRAVAERIAAVPASQRPLLLVSGESLGTFGASGAFDSLEDLLRDTDASLWTGTPSSVHLRQQAEDERVPGSLQIRPEWAADPAVLFANRPSDITAHAGTDVDAVFLQQADDAIVWWDWDVIWSEPDWLREPLDPAVNPDMRWYPVTTFLNLAVDMAVANAFEEEQGHRYGTQPALAWRAMLDPQGWDEAHFDALVDHLATIERFD